MKVLFVKKSIVKEMREGLHPNGYTDRNWFYEEVREGALPLFDEHNPKPITVCGEMRYQAVTRDGLYLDFEAKDVVLIEMESRHV